MARWLPSTTWLPMGGVTGVMTEAPESDTSCKGQLSAAKGVLDEIGAAVPLASLAKQEEAVFVPGRALPIRLARRTPGLKLLQQVRDEAHRFALSYHHNLRRKSSFKSELDAVPGIGPARRRALLRTFGSVAGVRDAEAAEIAAVKGITPKLAATLKLSVRI